MSDTVVSAILFGLTGTVGLAVIASSIAVSVRSRHGYTAMRISMALAWLWISMAGIGILQSMHSLGHLFGSKPSVQEIHDLDIGTAVMCIPAMVGIIAGIGTRRRVVRVAGRLIVYVISPGIFLWLLSIHLFRSGSLGFGWSIGYLCITWICWGILEKAGRDLRTV